jgi:transaldolase/glucose-6-phosphate isomerase
VWAGDATLWKKDEVHRKTIAGALGWLTIADRMTPQVPGLEGLAERFRGSTDRVLVLGMGGSSLAPLVFGSSFGRREGFPRLEVLDSTEPAAVRAAAEATPPGRTLYVVSSKSGTTLEPNLFFDYFFARADEDLGAEAGERFVVVTDPGTPLEEVARSRHAEVIVLADPAIGGRYSALSPFGVLPAALAGVDVSNLLARAREMAEACRVPKAEENPGAVLGAAMAAFALEGRDKLTFSVGTPVDRFGMWAEQLVAESTGKEGRGILPVEGEPLGPAEVYGEDRFFVRIGGAGDSMIPSRLAELEEAGHPVATFPIRDALDLGGEMFRWEFATALAGALLEINPFDQPNVQEAKDRTNEILSSDALRPPGPDEPSRAAALRGLLETLRPGNYFAVTAYVASTPDNEERLARIRLPVRDAKHVATTVGFGPRFLHSTGQLHKGGPDTGVFLQVTAEPEAPLPIPGRPYGFERVVAAQAAGDLAALRSRGRRAVHVHLPVGADPGLDSLAKDVAGAVRAASPELARREPP